MSNYPYQNNPVQRRSVPGHAPQRPQQQLQQRQQPTPPLAAATSPQPPYQESPCQQPPQQYQQQQYQHQQAQQQYVATLPASGNLAPGSYAPALPPRPPGGAGPFLAQTYMSFPPPPRSPNRPPVLPPRPQPSPQPQQQQQQQQQYQQVPPQAYPQTQAYPQAQPQAYAQPRYGQAAPEPYAYDQQASAQPTAQPAAQPAYGQPAAPAYSPAPAQAPAYSTPLAASPTPSGASSGQPPTSFQSGYYPPPPALPHQQQQQQQTADPNAATYTPAAPQALPTYDPYATQPVQPATAYPPAYNRAAPPLQCAPSTQATVVVDQKQPTTDPATATTSAPTLAPDNKQEYATSYNYYEVQAYPTPKHQAALPTAQQTPVTQQTPLTQCQTPSRQIQVQAPVDAITVSPQQPGVSPAVPVSLEQTSDPMQQINSMLQSMNIALGSTLTTIPSEPVELPASTGPEPQLQAQPVQPVHPTEPVYPTQQTQPVQQTQPLPPPPPQSATQPTPTAQPDAEDRPAYPEQQQQQYTQPEYAQAQYAAAPVPEASPTHTPAPVAARAPEVPQRVDPPFRPVISCIDTPMAFNTWWYTHPSAPEAYICSKCYMDYLYPTQFQDHFCGRFMRDGVHRRCRFKVPRITDQLIPDAQARGTLQALVDYMNMRLQIPDCKKLDGVKGGQGLNWFRPKHGAIPGLVICEACFQDVSCISPFAYSFEPSPPHDNTADVWSCNLAVPFVRKEFDERSKTSDWSIFCDEAKARLGMLACPKNTPSMISLRKWFTPVTGQGPADAVLCAACYCDRVLKTGQEKLWENMPRDSIVSKKLMSTCCAGQFNILMAFSAADDNKVWPPFWRALNKIANEEKPCVPAGIQDGKWYTLPSQPPGFCICGACYAGTIESLNISHLFVPQHPRNQPAPGTAVVCSMNVKELRFAKYMDLLLETWFTQDCTSWEVYTSRYANIPPCCRDEDYTNRAWYGWNECTICAQCYLEFVKGTLFDNPAAMSMHTLTVIPEARICEMYSPRMRKLYTEACSQSPPNPAALLSYSQRRRMIYWQTMPICRNILIQEKFMANNIAMKRFQSVAYTGMGNIASVTSNHHDHTYGQAGVGYGYDNQLALDGARYNVETNQMSTQLGGSKILIVGQLERQWRSVE